LPKLNGSIVGFLLISNESTDCKLNILKHVGSNSSIIHAVLHYGKNSKNSSIFINDPFTSFHIYKLNWNSKGLLFYVDDNELLSYNNYDIISEHSLKTSMNIVLNTVVKGGSDFIEDSSFQAKFIVDYVRYYENSI